MRFRTYKNTDLKVSEVGFGLWTISTGWWGKFTEDEAIALMHKAFDLGMTLFDAADTYGNGLSEENRSLGQAALQWLLADDRVASTLPNIYNEEQLIEFAKAPDTSSLTSDEMEEIAELHSQNFGVEEDPPKFKGTMELNETANVA